METVSWNELKIILAKNPAALPYYLDREDYYTVYTNHGGLIIGVDKLFKEDASEFETSYKSKCDSPEPQRMRVRTSREDYVLHARFISWKTADPSKVINNNNHHGSDYGDATYMLFDSYADIDSNTQSVNAANAKFTVLDFMPSWDFDIERGRIKVPDTLPGVGEWELHVIALPDVPEGVPTPVRDHALVANSRLDLEPGQRLELDAAMNHAAMTYSPYNTNKIRFILGHPAGSQADFQVRLNLYRGGLW